MARKSKDARLASMCKALGHPVRVQVLRLLRRHEYGCGELVELLPLAQSTVSQHLKVLREAGLIVGERLEGPRRRYRVHPEAVAALRDLVSRL